MYLVKFAIVEPMKLIGNFYEHMLINEYPHATIWQASDGPSGIRIALYHSPDLIIAHYRLSHLMCGDVMIREMRRQESLRTTPILAISAYAEDDDMAKRRMIEAGANFFLSTAQFRPDTFITTVRSLLPAPGQP